MQPLRSIGRIALGVMLAILVGFIPATRAYEVFQAHMGFGRMLNWTAKHKGTRRICWLTIRVAEYRIPEYLRTFSPDDWAVFYRSPYADAVGKELGSVRPLNFAPGLWQTNAVYGETTAWNSRDFRDNLLGTGTYVYRVGDLLAALKSWPPASSDRTRIELARVELIPQSEVALNPERLERALCPYPEVLPYQTVRIAGKGFSSYSVFVMNEVALPTRGDEYDSAFLGGEYMIAALPGDVQGCADAYVLDRGRRSNTLRVCLSK